MFFRHPYPVAALIVLFSLSCGACGPIQNNENESNSDSSNTPSSPNTTQDTNNNDEGNSTANDTTDIQDGTANGAFPNGFSVASPTADDQNHNRVILGAMQPPKGKSYLEKRAEIESLLSATSIEECSVFLPNINITPPNPQCYGPQLNYENHPDAMMGMPSSGQLPSGDLGIWTETEGHGQACVAAKLNNLVDTAAFKVDVGLLMGANLVCVMNTTGTALPAIGDTVDLSSEVADSLKTNNASLTVDLATLRREDDDDSGRAVYLYSFESKFESNNMKAIHINTWIRHRQKLDVSEDYEGQMWSLLKNASAPSHDYAYSLRYLRSPDGPIRSKLVGASYMNSASHHFDDNGDIAIDGDWNGNITQSIYRIDPEHGNVSVSFAWQAGVMDDKSRVFNAWAERKSMEEPATGCGFFGYGSSFSKEKSMFPDNRISTFICNWAGPSNDHTGLIGFAQKQCMTRNAEGFFVPSESKIRYAPINSCDSTDYPSFQYKLNSDPDWRSSPLPNELIELASDPDYARWVAPAWP